LWYGDDNAELDGWRHGRPQMGADTQFGIHPDFWANNKHPVFCKPNGLWTGRDNSALLQLRGN